LYYKYKKIIIIIIVTEVCGGELEVIGCAIIVSKELQEEIEQVVVKCNDEIHNFILFLISLEDFHLSILVCSMGILKKRRKKRKKRKRKRGRRGRRGRTG